MAIATQKIMPFLWFDGRAEEAVNLYCSVFKNAGIVSISYWKPGGPLPAGQVMTAVFELEGQRFHAFDAGPQFKFTEAISFFVNCETQEEIDYYWDRLIADGGEESMCGWLKDKFGVSWQIVPSMMGEYLNSEDPARAGRAMQAMMQMRKLDIAVMKKAYEG